MVSDKAVGSGFGRLYANRLGKNLSGSFARHRHLFEGLEGGYEIERGSTCSTIRDYDEAVTIHSFGWPSVDTYYQGEGSGTRQAG
jgi:predicted alpha/beta-fold hydrolase